MALCQAEKDDVNARSIVKTFKVKKEKDMRPASERQNKHA